jgi:hypothetical protein
MTSFSLASGRYGYRHVVFLGARNDNRFGAVNVFSSNARLLMVTLFGRSFGGVFWPLDWLLTRFEATMEERLEEAK